MGLPGQQGNHTKVTNSLLQHPRGETMCKSLAFGNGLGPGARHFVRVTSLLHTTAFIESHVGRQ